MIISLHKNQQKTYSICSISYCKCCRLKPWNEMTDYQLFMCWKKINELKKKKRENGWMSHFWLWWRRLDVIHREIDWAAATRNKVPHTASSQRHLQEKKWQTDSTHIKKNICNETGKKIWKKSASKVSQYQLL